ncbi:winged helix DNA-binding domain-containing protein [Nitriliruptoraceae bacterium ZYF776]|nr:winged helix DNA-binding domain-containing protein [Profundirhabdus halotolerans]
MHASDPQTPFLGVRARLASPERTVADLEAALYDERSLWRLHTIRRTIFVATRADATVLHAAATRDVAVRERRQAHRWLAAVLPEGTDVPAWEAEVRAEVLALLRDEGPTRTTDLHARIPAMATPIVSGSGRWTQEAPVGSRLLFLWAMDGEVVRTRPTGTWRNAQYRWAATDRWFDPPLELSGDTDEARVALVRRYLATHGPATETDVAWWTGWTKTATRRAVAAADAVPVALDGGGTAHVLADDVATDEPAARHVSFLPGLDPTPMGWKERDWYLGDHTAHLYDRNGNVGPTVWADGRIVGGWAVRDDGEVVHRLLEDVPARARRRIDAEAEAITAWLAGLGIRPRFRTPLERELCAT